MPGFLLSNLKKNAELENCNNAFCVSGFLKYKDFSIKRLTLNKFLLDKCLKEDASHIVVAEGVILNRIELEKKYHANGVFELIIEMYLSRGESFFDEFRGSFSGAFCIKEKNEWIVYTNHYGDNTVYYYHSNDKLVIGTQVNYLLDSLKENGISVSLDEFAAESLISYGYLSDDSTYVNEIKRLCPGHYITYKNGEFNIKKYYGIRPVRFDFSHMPEEKLIDELDIKFRKAVKLEYDKDEEYGYRHIAQLSGGLDSRMNLWVARDLGYDEILCMTFAQSGCLDEIIAKQVAKYLNVELIDWPLDTAKHLTHINDYIAMNYGSALYGGVGGEKEILDALDMNSFGLVHTGQLGDVVIGSYVKSIEEKDDLSIGGLYSELIGIDDSENRKKFEDREEYLMYVRGFLGILSSHLYTRNYSEVASPFLDIDFFDFCMSIPLELRINHYIYKKWIMKKYPEAATFVWEKTGRKINQDKPNKYLLKLKHVIKDPRVVLRKLGLISYSDQLITGMNPMDLWWKENGNLRKCFNACYESGANVEISKELQNSFKKLYEKGNTIEKMLVVTAISAINYYFKEC